MNETFAEEEVTPELRAELYSEGIAMGLPPHLASMLASTIKGGQSDDDFARWQAAAAMTAVLYKLQQDGIRMVNRHGIDVTDMVVARALAEMAK